MSPHVRHADVLEVLDRGGQGRPPRRSPACRPRTSSGTSFHSAPSSVTRVIMLPPVMNGGIASSSSRRPQSAPMPDGPSILWPERAAKSTPSAATSTGMCGTLCAASRTTSAPACVGRAAISATGLIVPSALLTWLMATSSAAGEPRAEVVEVELAVVGDRNVLERRAGRLGEPAATAPGWRGAPSRSTGPGRRPDVRAAPAVGHEVERLGRVAHEDDLALARRADERGERRARALEAGGGVLAQLVDAAVDVGVVVGVGVGHCLDHRARLLGRRGRRVEVRSERPERCWPVEDREVGAQRRAVEDVRRGACSIAIAWSASVRADRLGGRGLVADAGRQADLLADPVVAVRLELVADAPRRRTSRSGRREGRGRTGASRSSASAGSG